jgi:hypothetical protein
VEEAEWAAAFEAALQQSTLPDWEHAVLREVDLVERFFDERYLRVPSADSTESFSDMEAFVETVRSARWRDRLWRALSGRRPFRAFKDALIEAPPERERWFQFKQARMRERIVDWLRSEGVEALAGDRQA